ncbi:MAG: Zn-ribbon domain-containing OB-fold protein [Chloroflexi bacterium]|nr:Zn-ribbon domain-containing OB-fold protein [Chloroflexota bacterium]
MGTMTEEGPKRPVPQSNALTQPFWDATKEERLTVQRCTDCDRLFWYPREFCPLPHCFSNNYEWVDVSGKGRLHTFTIIAQAQDAWFQERVPYIFGVIQLDEGLRMMGNVDIPVEEAVCDLPVEVYFEKIDDDWTLPQWRPIAS